MLKIRPNCELCDCDLGPQAANAMICTYECTYCAACIEKLQNVCPTCGGGFEKRPLRPQNAWRSTLKLGLGYHPASTIRVHSRFSAEDIAAHVARIKDIKPAER